MEEHGLNVDQLATTLEPVPMALTAFFGIFLALMILALAFEEKLHAKKSVIVGVFAIHCGGRGQRSRARGGFS